jgi:hypothetical protein
VTDYTTLAVYAMMLIAFVFVIREVMETARTRLKTLASQQRDKPGKSLNAFLDNLPRIIEEQQTLRDKQAKAGATADVLKPLDNQLAQLRRVQQFEIPIRLFAPALERLPFEVLKAVREFVR